MERTGELIRGLVLLGIFVILACVVGWRWLKGSRDTPVRLIGKWTASALIIGFLIVYLMPNIMGGGPGGAFLVPFVAVCGVILALIWTPNITAFLARPFGNLIDGGDDEADPEPLYSIAIAKRKSGKFLESVAEVRKQLDRFPTDVVGQMMLAEIQADDLKDLPSAETTIERFVAQPGHSPKNIAYALNALADWQVKYAQDVDGARATLQRIIDTFPDSEEALLASQRLSHMGDDAYLLSRGNRPAIALKAGVENVGLLKTYEALKPVEEDKGETARKLVQHLERFPADMEAREKLAMLYAEHYQRVDLAADQLEQIIAQPGQPMKNVAHFLNLLADICIKFAGDYEAARAALERIIELYPKFAPAENARQRIAHLRLELKGRENKEAVKLGEYEQNIGLKRFRGTGARDSTEAER
jgi:outer membrane protein assembly factor BamD (BamD/ComL family)